MTATALGLLTFASTFGFALLGAYVRDRLPAPHLSKESQDVVRLGMGLIATMTALLLGLVTAAARGTFDGQDAAVKASAVNILTMDRHLARFGPETAQTRELLRRVLAFRIETTWPTEGGKREFGDGLPLQTVEDIENQIVNLSPQTDAQRWFKAEALRMSQEILKVRWRLLSSTEAIPRTFVVVIIFWLTVTFASFGLYAPRNATVLGVLFVAALSVAAAVFLILELDGPFDGIVRVSGEPLRFALANLGQ